MLAGLLPRFVRRAPEIPRRRRAMRLPALAIRPQGLRRRTGALSVGAAIALANAEVVHRQHVGASEREDQEHLHGPPADAADRDEPLDDLLVAQPRGRPARRHRARERMPRDVLEGAGLRPREARPPQGGWVRGHDSRRLGEAPAAEERDEAREDGLGGAAVQLLVGDGPRRRLVGRRPAGRDPARTVAADEPAHDGVAREMTVRRGRHGRRSSRDPAIGAPSTKRVLNAAAPADDARSTRTGVAPDAATSATPALIIRCAAVLAIRSLPAETLAESWYRGRRFL